MTTLYARNLDKTIKVWSIELVTTSLARITYGRLFGQTVTVDVKDTDVTKEVKSRIAKKKKEGYKSIEDLKIDSSIFTYELLDKVLPIFNVDDNFNCKPMKCQSFRERKLQYPVGGQAKLNGLRCVLKLEKVSIGEGMFAKEVIKPTLRTKEGLEYVLPHITDGLTIEQFKYKDIPLVFDGELYIHGKKLNYIKSCCPYINSKGTLSKPSGNPLEVKFFIFDLAIETTVQSQRIDILTYLNGFNSIKAGSSIFANENVRLVETVTIYSDYEATVFRNNCLKAGYEGGVFRTLDAEYAFGSRPSFIMKYKTHIDSEFLIVDIVQQEANPDRGMFVLRNDENDETFESMPSGEYFGTVEAQREILINKEQYIGKYATVRYRERSGVKNVPYHQNVIDIRDNNK